MWKGQHQDLDVAAKVLKVYSSKGLGKVKRVGRLGRSRFVMCTNESTMSCVEVLQGGCGMEHPSPSQRATTARRDDDRDSIRDGIEVDGKRERQRVCEGESQGGSVEACVFFAHGPYPRLSLTTA